MSRQVGAAGAQARTELRAAWRETAITNRAYLAFLLGLSVILGVGVWVEPLPVWTRAYELGALTVLAIGGQVLVVYIGAGLHSRQLGRMGEQATAQAVLSWRRKRKGWHLVNGLSFDRHGDVDHVLIGPGGVFAIESKWTSSPCWLTETGLTGFMRWDPTEQARHGARKIENLLRYGRDQLDLKVVPVVVLWGAGVPRIPGGHRYIDGTLVCEGRNRRGWLPELDRPSVATEVWGKAADLLGNQRDRQQPEASHAKP